ncbi:outer membrane beta-barrel protein [Flavobacterium sp.]|uniref:outer membrane beta-barrel protein n=1 Tax=Flavobacterium sp. TaxID=239 RepID=UPI003D11370B
MKKFTIALLILSSLNFVTAQTRKPTKNAVPTKTEITKKPETITTKEEIVTEKIIEKNPVVVSNIEVSPNKEIEKPAKAFEKGNKTIAFSLIYNSKKTTKTVDGKITESSAEPSITFAPQFHYSISDNFQLGAKLSFYSKSSTDNSNEANSQKTDESTNSYLLSARYIPLNKTRYFVNMDLDAGVVGSKSNTNDIATSFNTKGTRATLSIGAGYFITKKLALTVGLNDIIQYNDYTITYQNNNQTHKTKFETNIGNIQSIFMIDTFGLMYKF